MSGLQLLKRSVVRVFDEARVIFSLRLVGLVVGFLAALVLLTSCAPKRAATESALLVSKQLRDDGFSVESPQPEFTVNCPGTCETVTEVCVTKVPSEPAAKLSAAVRQLRKRGHRVSEYGPPTPPHARVTFWVSGERFATRWVALESESCPLRFSITSVYG